MNPYDPRKAAQVWQRVRENPAPEPEREENWQTLVQESLAAAAAYQALARQLPDRRQLLLQMSREARSRAACLRGICRLAQGSAPSLEPLPPPRERPGALLRKCYSRCLRCQQEYDRNSRHPEYGPACRRLADREREDCQRLLEMLGTLAE